MAFTNYPLKPIDFINLTQHLTVLLCKFVTISLLSSLLLIAHFRPNKLRVNGLSPAMHFYIFTHCACSAMGIPYQVYTSFCALLYYFGHPLDSASVPSSSPFSPYGLFWTGIWEINYYSVAPIAVTFLALERCLTLRFGAISNNFWRINKFLIAFGVLTISASWCVSTVSYLTELPLQVDKVSKCSLVACLAVKTLSLTQSYIKNVFGVISIFSCMAFLWVLHSSKSFKNMKNRVIKFTILGELAFDILPGILILTFNSATGISLSLYVGEIGITFCNIDAFVCSVIYWHLLIKRNTNANNSVLAHSPKTIAIWGIKGTNANKR